MIYAKITCNFLSIHREGTMFYSNISHSFIKVVCSYAATVLKLISDQWALEFHLSNNQSEMKKSMHIGPHYNLLLNISRIAIPNIYHLVFKCL